MVVAGIAVVASIALTIAFAAVWRRTDLDRFWAPVVDASSPAVMCVGQPKAYRLASGSVHEMEAWVDQSSKGENPPALGSIPFSDLKPVWDRYITLVDAQAMLPLCQLLTRKGKKVEIRGGRVSSLADLRGKPCIFIGAFNNEWTMRLTSDLRFYFELGPNNGSMVIRDRQDVNRQEWAGPRSWPAPLDLASDYAIVTRMYNPTIEQTVVSVAGASGFGTYAGGEFLANDQYFAAALRSAPRDWHRKNMQVVLSVKVISGTPGPLWLLAAHFRAVNSGC